MLPPRNVRKDAAHDRREPCRLFTSPHSSLVPDARRTRCAEFGCFARWRQGRLPLCTEAFSEPRTERTRGVSGRSPLTPRVRSVRASDDILFFRTASSEPTALPLPGGEHHVSGSGRLGPLESDQGVRQLPAQACGKGIWERRMREIRPSGVMRDSETVEHGMRLLGHTRGNPVRSPTLPGYRAASILFKSHTMTLVSCAPDARKLPSSLKRSALIGPRWPMKVCSTLRCRQSYTRTP